MKIPEELNALREEFEALNGRFAELNEDELAQVAGGYMHEEDGNEGGSISSIEEEGQKRDEFLEYIAWLIKNGKIQLPEGIEVPEYL